ncbi:hypothetical protein [Asticcacaulis solisilvae]|uniref:hypothetical protein n=1 Tax=Asticcacaulis solisilvae TaxID=1217274 RepID=UPI003FD87C40
MKRLVLLALQFTVVVAAVAGGFAANDLYGKGIAYADTQWFRQDLDGYARIGLAAGGLFVLVVICYHLTRKGLDDRPDPFDTDKL